MVGPPVLAVNPTPGKAVQTERKPAQSLCMTCWCARAHRRLILRQDLRSPFTLSDGPLLQSLKFGYKSGNFRV